MLKFVLNQFNDKVEGKYESLFYEKLYLNNLERAYLISVVGVVSFFLLLVAGYFNMRKEAIEDTIIQSMLFVTHAMLSFLLIPAFFRMDDKEFPFAFLYRNKQVLFFTALSVLGFSLMPMAILALQSRGSIAVFAIFIVLINLGFNLPHKANIAANLLIISVVSLGIVYVVGDEDKMLSYLFESWALTGMVFLIANYQFQVTIKEFNYKMLLEEKNQIIQSQLEAEFNKKIAEIEMKALRAQMNPHFLFNVLNSIKLYMVQNDARTAAKYLTKFSRLIRLILNNSKSSMIKLDEELSALLLYIEMENFRFNDKFDFELCVEEGLPTHEIEIPPMILQPFVENAIWHGLMHKEEERGTLSIQIQSNISKDKLCFIIQDNGIGREKAQQIKTRTAAKHQSVGMQITNDRLAIVNEIFKTDASLEVIDLKDNSNPPRPLGTKVVLYLPLHLTTNHGKE
jgi:sensor histidine kinase YesM